MDTLFEQEVSQEELDAFVNDMMESTTLIIEKIQERSLLKQEVQRIKLTYLIDTSNFNPWFIGSEYCHVLTRRKVPKTNESSDTLKESTTQTKMGMTVEPPNLGPKPLTQDILKKFRSGLFLDSNKGGYYGCNHPDNQFELRTALKQVNKEVSNKKC